MEHKSFIITEGQSDTEIINQLLPDITDEPNAVNIVTASGYSSALAMARSVLLQTRKPALLLLDADTTEPTRVKEKQAFVEDYVKVNGMKCQVLLAVPTLEVLFFHDKGALEKVLQKTISDDFWRLAKQAPKQALNELTGDTQTAANSLLSSPQFRNQIEQTPIINEIRSFLQAA